MIPKALEDLRRFLPITLKVILNTGSSSKQGVIMRGGKKITHADKYKESTAVCFLNPEDMKKLGFKDKGRVMLKTNVGEIVLFAEKGENPKGVVFVPKGPWINSVIDAETMQTGSPNFKGMDAEIKSTDDDVLDVRQILENYSKKGHKWKQT